MKGCEDVQSEKRSGNEISQLVRRLCCNNRFVNNVRLSRKAKERSGGGTRDSAVRFSKLRHSGHILLSTPDRVSCTLLAIVVRFSHCWFLVCFRLFVDSRTIISGHDGEARTFPYYYVSL